MKDVKTQNKNKVNVFSLLAAILFVLLTVGTLVYGIFNLADHLIYNVEAVQNAFEYAEYVDGYDGAYWDAITCAICTISSTIRIVLSVLVTALMFFVSAIILFVSLTREKFRALVFFPLGVLTFVLWENYISFAISFIISFLLSFFVGVLDFYYNNSFYLIVSDIGMWISLLAGIVIAAIIGILIYVMAISFCRNKHFIPAILLLVISLLGGIGVLGINGIYIIINAANFINNFEYYLWVIEDYDFLEGISYFFEGLYSYLVYPIIIVSDWSVRHLFTMIATLFVALGAIKLKKKLKAAEEQSVETNVDIVSEN